MLDAAPSPLISALPQYERSFLDHLSIGQAYHRAMQVRSALPVICHSPFGMSSAAHPCSFVETRTLRRLPSHLINMIVIANCIAL